MLKTKVVIFASDPVCYKHIKSLLKTKKFISVAGYLYCLNAAKDFVTGGEYGGVLLIDDSLTDRTAFNDFINSLLSTPAGDKTIIYTSSEDPGYLKWLVDYGVRSIVHKKSPKENIIEAIKLISSGGCFIDGRIEYYIFRKKITSDIHSEELIRLLTEREREVLLLISEGLENKAIAEKLFISPKTVSHHKENIKSKLSVSSVKELYSIEIERSGR